MQVKEDADKNRFLSVVVELAPGVEESEDKRQAIATSILTQLLRLNGEFANYVPPEYQTPQIALAPMGDREYFPIGVTSLYTPIILPFSPRLCVINHTNLKKECDSYTALNAFHLLILNFEYCDKLSTSFEF